MTTADTVKISSGIGSSPTSPSSPSKVTVAAVPIALLPVEELRAGYAEVVKTALIAGGGLWERVLALPPLLSDQQVGQLAYRTATRLRPAL